MDDDAQLLRRYARDGAEEAFAELVRRHLGLVYGSALRRVNQNTALAEEVAQSVFASVASEADELEKKVAGGVALAGWLYVATRHAAANVLRAEVRRVRREQEAFVMSELESGGASGASGASDAEVWAQVRPELEAVMDELGESDRVAVLLRFFEGRAFGEIGAALRVSEDAARVRVNRALEKLRELLARRGITSTAAALGGLLAGNVAVAAPVGMAASVTASVLAGGVAVVSSVGAASAAGVSGLGTGILSFMTTTKLVTGMACVVAAVSVGTAVWQDAEIRRVRAEMDGVRLGRESAITALEAELTASRSKIEELTKAARTGDAQVQSARNTGKQPAVNAEPIRGPAVSALDALYGDPKYVEASLRRARAELPFIYGPLYRRLKLSPEQIKAFENAMLEMQTMKSDVFAAARSQGVSIDDGSVAVLMDGVTAKGWESLRIAIGAEHVEAYKKFRNETRSWEALSPLIVEVAFSDMPLTSAQADELVRLSALHQLRRTEGKSTITQGYDWTAIVSGLEKTLSPGQLALVKTYGEKESAELALSTLRASKKR